MRVLVVDAFDQTVAAGCRLGSQVVSLLERAGNDVDLLLLGAPEFAGFMTADERRAYETDSPMLDPVIEASAARVQAADALVFVYPTVLFGTPPVLKSWLERVMVMGVAFKFDDKQRVKPALTNVRRLAVVTSTPHSPRATRRARDLGYRTFMRTLRLNCHPACRRTFVRLPNHAPAGRIDDQLARSFRRWR